MAEDPYFSVVVVGGGVAGCSAAIRLAQQGVDVLLVERADESGTKNLSGGILWGNDLATILPDWASEAPVERPVTNKKIGLLGEQTAMVVDFHDERLKDDIIGYAVLRSRFDKWLMEQAVKAGVTVVTGVNVDDLYMEGDTVKGVVHQGEVTRAHVVILAEGANSRIALKRGLHHGRDKLDPHNYALGVKEIFQMAPAEMEKRFQIGEGEGMAGEFVVGNPDGVMMGGFVYTNKDTISLGVVINLNTLEQQEKTSHDLVEEFRNHPYIRKLVGDAKLVEYGAHLVPEGGYLGFPELYRDGVLVCGDAAGFCFSNGVVIQGMNYAIRSAICAADAAKYAVEKQDATATRLRKYEQLLVADGMADDFKKFRNVSEFLWNPRMFKTYPMVAADALRALLDPTGPKKKFRDHVRGVLKAHQVKTSDLVKDAISAGVKF